MVCCQANGVGYYYCQAINRLTPVIFSSTGYTVYSTPLGSTLWQQSKQLQVYPVLLQNPGLNLYYYNNIICSCIFTSPPTHTITQPPTQKPKSHKTLWDASSHEAPQYHKNFMVCLTVTLHETQLITNIMYPVLLTTSSVIKFNGENLFCFSCFQ